MENTALIIEILEEFWGYECEIAGPTNTEDIALGVSGFTKVDGASNLDLQTALTTLVLGVELVKHSLEVYKALSSNSSKKPSSKDFKNKVEQGISEQLNQIEESKRFNVYEEILKKLNI